MNDSTNESLLKDMSKGEKNNGNNKTKSEIEQLTPPTATVTGVLVTKNEWTTDESTNKVFEHNELLLCFALSTPIVLQSFPRHPANAAIPAALVKELGSNDEHLCFKLHGSRTALELLSSQLKKQEVVR